MSNPENIKRNPGGPYGGRINNLKWRVVLLLTGGEIEAVPLFPYSSGIPSTRTIKVKLGQPGALNTVQLRYDDARF